MRRLFWATWEVRHDHSIRRRGKQEVQSQREEVIRMGKSRNCSDALWKGKKRPQAKESRQPPGSWKRQGRILFQEPMEEPALPTS